MISGSDKPDYRSADPFDNHHYSGLFNELYTPLCRFSMKFVTQKDAAEDIVQEVFIYLWEHWKRLADIPSLRSYAYTAVKNRSLNYLQKQNRIKTKNAIPEIPESIISISLPDPQELMESNELEEILEKALQALPMQCRTILTMKRFGELSNIEVAGKLKLSIKTVEAQMTIALRKIATFVSVRWG
jgi:RNA polymerase sigma-70 factor (ECF subfamily)